MSVTSWMEGAVTPGHKGTATCNENWWNLCCVNSPYSEELSPSTKAPKYPPGKGWGRLHAWKLQVEECLNEWCWWMYPQLNLPIYQHRVCSCLAANWWRDHCKKLPKCRYTHMYVHPWSACWDRASQQLLCWAFTLSVSTRRTVVCLPHLMHLRKQWGVPGLGWGFWQVTWNHLLCTVAADHCAELHGFPLHRPGQFWDGPNTTMRNHYVDLCYGDTSAGYN